MATQTKGRSRVRDTLDGQNRYIDNMVEWYRTELSGMVASAQARLLAKLAEKLVIDGGRVLQTPGNMRILRSLDDLLMQALNKAGFRALTDEFVMSFNGHLPYMEQMLEAISETLKTPLPKAKLTATDVSILESQQISASEGLSTIVEMAGTAAKRRAMFSVAAAPFADIVDQIATTLNRSIGEAVTLAETSQVMFARTTTDRAFRQIETGLKKGTVQYGLDHPMDKLTRPFCKRLIMQARSGKTWTREQIEQMDNGQLPNPMITFGGYNCRGSWTIKGLSE